MLGAFDIKYLKKNTFTPQLKRQHPKKNKLRCVLESLNNSSQFSMISKFIKRITQKNILKFHRECQTKFWKNRKTKQKCSGKFQGKSGGKVLKTASAGRLRAIVAVGKAANGKL